jgi:hypothetical protein
MLQLCSMCQDDAAMLHCNDCNKLWCYECFGLAHRKGAAKAHVQIPISAVTPEQLIRASIRGRKDSLPHEPTATGTINPIRGGTADLSTSLVNENQKCSLCKADGAQTYRPCQCIAPLTAHLQCKVNQQAAGSGTQVTVGAEGWTHCADCNAPYAGKVQLAMIKGLCRKIGGRSANDPGRLAASTAMGTALLSQGFFKQAVRLFESVVAAYHQSVGPEHTNSLLAASNLAAALSGLGQHADAVQIFFETWTSMKALKGPHHPDSLQAGANVVAGLRRQGELERAAEIHKMVLGRQRTSLGEMHPDTLLSANKLKGLHDEVMWEQDGIPF